MPCVHYKFSSKLSHDTVMFDGLHITLEDLKRQIMKREKLKRCDLCITDDQTNKEFTDDACIIPINSTVTVRRIPAPVKSTYNRHAKNWSEPSSGSSKAQVNGSSLSLEQLFKTENLVEANASEEDKIKAVMFQSSCCYYSTNEALKLVGVLPPKYVCFNCGIPGHHIRNCPKTMNPESFVVGKRIRRSAGIPFSFLMEVNEPNRKGVMLSNNGRHVIPIINAEAYATEKNGTPPFLPQNESSSSTSDDDPVPDAFLCQICRGLMTDAVMTPCCSNSYCDECIRTCLLDSDEHVCPTCKQSHVSPDALNMNTFLRQELNRFKNRSKGSSFSHPRKRLYSHSACSSTSPSFTQRSSSSVSEPQNDGEVNGSRPLHKKSKHSSS